MCSLTACILAPGDNGYNGVENDNDGADSYWYRDDKEENDKFREEYSACNEDTQYSAGSAYHRGDRKEFDGGEERVKKSSDDSAEKIKNQESFTCHITFERRAEEEKTKHVIEYVKKVAMEELISYIPP